MKTPEEKYWNDPEYNALVKTLEGFIHSAQFTPSELREAAILAAIHYERDVYPRKRAPFYTPPPYDSYIEMVKEEKRKNKHEKV